MGNRARRRRVTFYDAKRQEELKKEKRNESEEANWSAYEFCASDDRQLIDME